MSEATLRHIMQRIEGATRHSQIADSGLSIAES